MKVVTLSWFMSQLMYDIKNYAYIEAMSMDENDVRRSQIMEIGEEGNIDRVRRVLDLKIAIIGERLYPYTKRFLEDEAMLHDKLCNRDGYSLELNVPDDFSATTALMLERVIHEMLVCWVMSDWLSRLKPESWEIWETKAGEMFDGLTHSLTARIGRVRRTQTPF